LTIKTGLHHFVNTLAQLFLGIYVTKLKR